MTLWGWQGFIFGYLGLRWLSYFYLLGFFLLWLKTSPKLRLKKPNLDPLTVLIILVGSVIQISMVFLTGIYQDKGLYFCCGAISDNIYHLEVTYEVINKIPPFEAGMYGEAMRNYHYWGNLVVGELVRVFHLPLMATEFRYFTILLSLSLGLLAVIFGQLLKLSKNFTRWLLFFLYFGGDFIYILQLIFTRKVNFEMGPLENGSSFLMNPPRAFAMIGFFAGLCLLVLWIKRKDLYSGLLMALIFGSLIGFKVYVGIFALTGFFALSIYYALKKKLRMIIPFIIALFAALIVYLPVNKGAGGLFFTYFWRFEEFISQPLLGLSRLELARLTYAQEHNWKRVFLYEGFYVVLFIFGIFGSKILGLFQNKKSLSLFGVELNIFLLFAIFVSSIAGFFFQQHSGGANAFNFLVSVYIIGSLYTTLACYYWLPKTKKLKLILIFLLVATTIPRVIYEENKNIQKILNTETRGLLLTNDKLAGLRFVKENTKKSSLVLAYNTSYFTFLAERPVFLGDEGILYSHTIDTSKRLQAIKVITENPKAPLVYKELIENNIDYLYLPAGFMLPSTDSARFLKPVFQNKEVKILKFTPYL